MEVTLSHQRLPFTGLQGIPRQMTYVMMLSPGSQDLVLILSYILVNVGCSVSVNPNQLVFDIIPGLFCTSCTVKRWDSTLPSSVHAGPCDVL
jgi:hypothetical protein